MLVAGRCVGCSWKCTYIIIKTRPSHVNSIPDVELLMKVFLFFSLRHFSNMSTDDAAPVQHEADESLNLTSYFFIVWGSICAQGTFDNIISHPNRSSNGSFRLRERLHRYSANIRARACLQYIIPIIQFKIFKSYILIIIRVQNAIYFFTIV